MIKTTVSRQLLGYLLRLLGRTALVLGLASFTWQDNSQQKPDESRFTPDFAQNHWVYRYYAHPTEKKHSNTSLSESPPGIEQQELEASEPRS